MPYLKQHGKVEVDANTDIAAFKAAGWDVAAAEKAIAADKAKAAK